MTLFVRIWVGGKVDKDELGMPEEEEVGLFIVAFLLVNAGLMSCQFY